MEGKRVLITGASSGVGMAAARRFSAEGATVALVARRADVIEQLATDLGDGAHACQADVADPQSVAGAVTKAADALGGLDIVVNAAGSVIPTPLEDLDATAWKASIDVNLSGTFHVAREAALIMRATDAGGVIINVGSELSSIGMGQFVHYCAAKAGVIGMTKALAAKLAPKVRVNVVCPGPIDTPMMDGEFALTDDPVEARKEAIERVPLKRFATADEVVAAIRFLAVEAPFATGAVLPLDGGTTVV